MLRVLECDYICVGGHLFLLALWLCRQCGVIKPHSPFCHCMSITICDVCASPYAWVACLRYTLPGASHGGRWAAVEPGAAAAAARWLESWVRGSEKDFSRGGCQGRKVVAVGHAVAR